MKALIDWFSADQDLDPVRKAGVAHLLFVTIHPFDDGNGHIARAIADMQLARSEESSQRFYSMSKFGRTIALMTRGHAEGRSRRRRVAGVVSGLSRPRIRSCRNDPRIGAQQGALLEAACRRVFQRPSALDDRSAVQRFCRQAHIVKMGSARKVLTRYRLAGHR
jgi:hypothetical protein